MGDNKIDITSTVLEKSIDLVKGFLEKLVGAPLEETGLMIADNIKLIRFKNQIKIFEKAQRIVEESSIKTKHISLKALVPLIEYSSLEEDETLQDKWSNLIVNFADSEETYTSTIFPFILNQISKDELEALENLHTYLNIGLSYNQVITDKLTRANLTRLGLVELIIDVNPKKVRSPFANLQSTNKGKLVVSELGRKFILCCSPKNKKG